jgi:hypothetical protein
MEALREDWTIELRCSSAQHPTPHQLAPVRSARKAIAGVRKRVLLDNQEIWSHSSFRSWQPEVDGALLIGWPMSPVAYAAARLSARGIPYVVDVGDPWVLTHPDPDLYQPAAARAARAERRLWAGASGVVMTTTTQAGMISSLYPGMPVLVRPNGYQVLDPTAIDGRAADPRAHSPDILNLVHFGTLSPARIDPSVPLSRLVNSGYWREVNFSQYGSDWNRTLDGAAGVAVTRHDPLPWQEAVAVARNCDAAIVFGFPHSLQMPSKVVQYLTLPIPRVAITSTAHDDTLRDYLADKPGWLCSQVDSPALAEQLSDHLSRPWSAAELAPPRSEAWPHVADEIASFVNRVLAPTPSRIRGRPARLPVQRGAATRGR